MRFIRKDLEDFSPYIVDTQNYNIKLDANESFINYDGQVLENIKKAVIDTDFNRYPDAYSSRVCDLYLKYLCIDNVSIMAGNGSDELIQIISNTFINKDDLVMVLDPDFSMYTVYTKLAKGSVIKCSLDDNFDVDIDGLIDSINSNGVKVLFLSNPNNPTGNIIEKEKLLYLVEKANCIVVIDEAYMEFYGDSIIHSINDYDNLIVLRTLSKAVALAGLRLGFMLTNKDLYDQIYKAKPPFNVNSISQNIASAVLEEKDIIKNSTDKILGEKEFLYNGLKDLKCLSICKSYANFFLVKCNDSSDINNYLKANSIVVRHFGKGRLRDYLRITVGNREENKVLINTLREYDGE